MRFSVRGLLLWTVLAALICGCIVLFPRREGDRFFLLLVPACILTAAVVRAKRVFAGLRVADVNMYLFVRLWLSLQSLFVATVLIGIPDLIFFIVVGPPYSRQYAKLELATGLPFGTIAALGVAILLRRWLWTTRPGSPQRRAGCVSDPSLSAPVLSEAPPRIE